MSQHQFLLCCRYFAYCRVVFFFKQKTAYEMRISYWSSDVCSSDLRMASAFGTEMVLDVRHWTDDYFSFTTTRDDGFRFDNGQFVMIGLEVDGRPLLRAYSIASANWEEQLEFFSIKVPGGPLTSRL